MAFGYKDTPTLTNGWHVHDGERPQPRIVTPGGIGGAPSDGIVLFRGGDLSGWVGRDGDARWRLEEDYMQVEPGTGDITSKEIFGDMQLHIEFACPAEVKGEGQGRGNSGVFLMNRYEIQVLDCYENQTYADGSTGAIYGEFPPLVNACRKPGEWQAYDIFWKAPRFDGDSLVAPAYVTIMHNGIMIHHHCALLGPTGHRNAPEYTPHGDAPIRLQDHGDLVRYRNIWARRVGDYDEQ